MVAVAAREPNAARDHSPGEYHFLFIPNHVRSMHRYEIRAVVRSLARTRAPLVKCS